MSTPKRTKMCVGCKKSNPATEEFFYFHKGKAHGRCKECNNSPEERAKRVVWNRGIRLQALQAYSGKYPFCVCCGEKTLEFLGIDHINGGGGQHRKELVSSGLTIYLWLRKKSYPEGFQVLCHNCNLAKGYYGVCPHKLTN